jgi:hypothetical protein
MVRASARKDLDPRAVARAPFPRYLSALARPGGLAARLVGEWCNGNTAVFGTVILGSSPSSPATPVGRHNSLDSVTVNWTVRDTVLETRRSH